MSTLSWRIHTLTYSNQQFAPLNQAKITLLLIDSFMSYRSKTNTYACGPCAAITLRAGTYLLSCSEYQAWTIAKYQIKNFDPITLSILCSKSVENGRLVLVGLIGFKLRPIIKGSVSLSDQMKRKFFDQNVSKSV